MSKHMTVGDARAEIIRRLDTALDNYIGAPKGDDWMPSMAQWDRVYDLTKRWMSMVSHMSKSAVHRDRNGRILTAMDMTTLFFKAMKTGKTEYIDSAVVLHTPVRCIRITLKLEEDQDGEEEEEDTEVGDTTASNAPTS